jgi:hypothetical protein
MLCVLLPLDHLTGHEEELSPVEVLIFPILNDKTFKGGQIFIFIIALKADEHL